MSEAYLHLRAINKDTFEGDANLDNDFRLEIFLMREGRGWHLGIRFHGYFHFRMEENLDGTYGCGYLMDKIEFMSKATAESLQRLLKSFFVIYHTPEIFRGNLFNGNGRFKVPELVQENNEED